MLVWVSLEVEVSPRSEGFISISEKLVRFLFSLKICLRRSYTYRPFWTKLHKKMNCKCNLFWIKWAKAEVLKLTLSSVIAFSRKKFVVTFLWDRIMDFHGTQSKLFIIYVVMGLRVAILRYWCVSIFFMPKTDFFAIIFSIFLNF